MKKNKTNKVEFAMLEGNERNDLGFKTESAESVSKEKNAFMVTMRIEDFSPEKNSKFKEEGNKSYPRDGLRCMNCHHEVVMSGNLYDVYRKNPNNPQVICARCFPVVVAKYENE